MQFSSRYILLAAFFWILSHAGITACKPRKFNTSPDSQNNATKYPDKPDGEIAARNGYTFNVMAPLVLPESEAEWISLKNRLAKVKQLGAYAVSTDVWWQLVEGKAEGEFDWSGYVQLADAIRGAGLKWSPILSFHQCGGNVGDVCDYKIPQWVWRKYPDAATRSEFQNESKESISVWATQETLGEYVSFMSAFRKKFGSYAKDISEINISFGPAGELRYPSYNSHDGSRTEFPSRGGIQAYSEVAQESFRAFVLKKYKTAKAAGSAWGIVLKDPSEIRPPESGEEFFRTGAPRKRYGRDFYTWYRASLLERGNLVGTAAIKTLLDNNSPFQGINLGGKVPGIHWRMGTDRLAEMNAGLIVPPTTDNALPAPSDYAEIVKLFGSLDAAAKVQKSRFILHFTCLEMSDEPSPTEASSKAKSLVQIMGDEAVHIGVIIKGENALAGKLNEQESWKNMKDALFSGPYRGLTLLRFDDVLNSEVAVQNFSDLVQIASRRPASAPTTSISP